MWSRFDRIQERDGQTDGQTDERTDRQTDRQTDERTELLYQYRASVCWHTIKIRSIIEILWKTAPCAKFHWNRTIGCWVMTKNDFFKWPPATILNFMGPIMGSLKSPCETSYRSSIEFIALNCLVLGKTACLYAFGDKQTDKAMNRWTQPMRKGPFIATELNSTRQREQQLTQFVGRDVINNKKLSYRWQTYRWQTARCWFVKLLRYGKTFCQNT